MFDTARFLDEHFGNPDGLIGLVAKHCDDVPSREAARKMFERASVSGQWLPVLLLVLEREYGPPVSMIPYMGAGSSIFD